MATRRSNAAQGPRFLLPIAGDSGAQTLATAKRFGPFVAGQSIVIGSSAAFHVVCGDNTIAATTASPKFATGMYNGEIPDGCTYVSMIDSADGAGAGQAYAG